MRRSFRDHLESRKDRVRPHSYRPVVLHLEDRVVPGDTLLGALTAHGFVLPRDARPVASTSRTGSGLAVPGAVGSPLSMPSLLRTASSQPAVVGGDYVFAAGLAPASDFGDDPLDLAAAFQAAPAAGLRQHTDESGAEPAARFGGAGTTGGESQAPRAATAPVLVTAAPLGDSFQWVFTGGATGPGNNGPGAQAPNTPTIVDPTRDGAIVSPSIHMETAPFSDPNPEASHYASEWEIRMNEPGQNERIWTRYVTIEDPDNPDGSLLTHIHLGDGYFEGSHKGQTLLRTSTNYRLRVRFESNLGESSAWSERTFQTQPQIPGDPDRRWTARQAGYQVQLVASDFKLPVNLAFVPNPSFEPGTPLYYVTELYGEVKVVTADGHVRRYAGADASDPAQRPNSLINFNPTGQFPGSGEQGTTGIVVDPNTGDVFVSTVWSIAGDAAGSPHYGRVFRLESDDGGLTAARRTVIFDTACQLQQGPNCGEEQGQSHQISNLSFGPDGYLYVHNGEGFDAARAQNVNSFGGKIMRMNLDGSPVPENPFFQANCTHPVTGRPCARNYVYALGVRNPFGGGWWARNGRHYTVENGPGTNDRFSELVEGRNYLWNGSDQSMTNFALYNWNPPQAPVNIAFIQPETFGGSGYPKEKYDHAFVSLSGPTYGQGPQANGKRIQEFVLDPETGARVSGPTTLIEYTGTGRSSVVGLTAGPDGLYFTDLYRDDGVGGPVARGANVYRVKYVGFVDFAATANASCGAPLTVEFTDRSTGGNTVAWAWNFGDGTTSEEQNPIHTYTQAGRYTVTLTVTDDQGNERTLSRPNYIGAGRVGLRAEAYPLGDLAQVYQYNGPRQTRIDATVNFDLNSGLTFPALGTTNFYATWTGQVTTPNAAGTYTFSTISDDGVRLWVNNQLIINNWTFHAPTTDTGTIQLAANTAYDIRMDFFQGGGGAEARLRWTPPGQPLEVIPQSQLCPTMASTALVAPSNLRTTAVTKEQIDLAWLNNSNNATSIQIEYSTDGQNFDVLDTVLPDVNVYSVYPGEPGRYFFRVRALNDFGNAVSNTISVRFQVPAILDYSTGFGNPAGLTRNGSAAFTANVARLTSGATDQGGSVFSDERVGIREFTTTFTFRIYPGSNPMADGMAFVIQGNSPTALGPAGGGLGYGPDQPGCCGITRSVALKFDIYNNAGEGENSTGLFTDGASPSIPRGGSGDVLQNLAGTGIDLRSQHVFRVTIGYSGTTLTFRIVNLTTMAEFSRTYTVDIAAKVGGTTAHVGFTGGTGGLTAIQDVQTWRFESLVP